MKRVLIISYIIGLIILWTMTGKSQISNDVRLHKEVSLWHKSLPLSDLLKHITKQTNVSFQISKQAPYLRFHLFVQRRRAWEVLEALTKLLSMDDTLKVQWVRKGDGYFLEIHRSKDINIEWQKFLRSLLDALPDLAEGKSVNFSFNGIPVQGINDPWASKKWRFVASLSTTQKEQLLKGKLISMNFSELTSFQKINLEDDFVQSFPLLPKFQQSTKVFVGLQSWRAYTPSILTAVQFEAGTTYRSNGQITPLVKDFETTVLNHHRKRLHSLSSITDVEKKREVREIISLIDWASTVGRRVKIQHGYIHDLPVCDYLEWVAITTNITIISEETKAIRSQLFATSPKTLAEALERVPQTYHLLWFRYNNFYLFYNPFRWIPIIDHSKTLMSGILENE